jgi:hypothetical protein
LAAKCSSLYIHSNSKSRVALNTGVHQALDDFCLLASDIESLPTQIAELVSLHPAQLMVIMMLWVQVPVVLGFQATPLFCTKAGRRTRVVWQCWNGQTTFGKLRPHNPSLFLQSFQHCTENSRRGNLFWPSLLFHQALRSLALIPAQ